jgi:hypothetical protein
MIVGVVIAKAVAVLWITGDKVCVEARGEVEFG